MKNIDPDQLRLKDILQAIDDIEGIHFTVNSVRRDLLAICYSLAVIGEATGKLSDAIKVKYNDVPCRDFITMRHKIVHDYGKIDIPIVLAVVSDDIPVLKEHTEIMLRENS